VIIADATIIAPPRATPDQATSAILAHPHGEYSEDDIRTTIVFAYFTVCRAVGVDPLVAVAQLIHETNNLTSALSQRTDKGGRDLRNPAGIGVYEARDKATAHYRPGTVYDADVGGYRPACQFPTWANNAIPAHVGRLLAYATKPEQRTEAQATLVARAMAYRNLPAKCHGSAPTLRELGTDPNAIDGCGWASPGQGYGAALAAIMNHIRGLE
jgi:hypothetical protein